MRWDIAGRGAAIGVALGAAAAAETVRSTPALHPDAAGLLAPLEFCSLFVCLYGTVGAAVGMLLGALGPLARLGAARAFWPLLVLALLFAAWNEGARRIEALGQARYLGRGALALAAVAVAAHALRRPSSADPQLHTWERALTWLLVPAAAGTFAYASRDLPAHAAEGAPRDVLALAPRFEPEPPEAFARVVEPGRPRVLLIGVDGADWSRIERGVAAGRLPAIAQLIRSGVAGPLRSAEPTYSPRLWTTIVTGVAPSAHGIEDFYLDQLPRLGVESLRLHRSFGLARAALERAGELRFVPVTSSLRRRKAIWNLADEAGLASVVLGLWATWPPEPLAHGVVVSDHASVARQQEWLDRGKTSDESQLTTWPPALADELAPLQRKPDSVTREELARYVALDDATWRAFEATRRFSKDVPLSAFRSSHLNDAFYARAALRIWRERRTDLMVVYLRAVDELSHFFLEASVPEAESLGWSATDARRFGGVVDEAYAATDREIEPLVADALGAGDVLVLLVSDHGWEREPDGRWNHNRAPPGVLIAAGAGVCRAACPPLADPSIFDIAPTVLGRLGLPISDEIEGRMLHELFASQRETTRVARYGAPLTRARAIASRRDAALREKLEALGYVDP